MTEKSEPVSFEQIEADMWKNNIKKGPRVHKDFLDTSNEDFALNKSKGLKGTEITPSSFNIFRDSLRKASERLTETLNENLPEMNLGEITESESEVDDDVLPLDFRTALIEKENRIVIQAKPLVFKTQFDDDEKDKNMGPSLDAYLEMVNKKAFKEEDGAIMLDPDINIKEKFEQIDLPCNKVERMNNSIYAPVRKTPVQKSKLPANTKTYDTDSGVEEEEKSPAVFKGDANFKKVMSAKLAEAQRAETFAVDKSDPLSFDQSLQQMGLDDVDEILEPEHRKQGIVDQVMEKNRKYAKDTQDKEEQFDLMQGLNEIAEEQQDSDVAPVSPYADALTVEEQIKNDEKNKQTQFLKSINAISSASETDEKQSDTESNKAKKIAGVAKIKSMQTGLQPIKEGSGQSAKKKKKVSYYKGMMVMSDTEDNIKSPTKQPQQEEIVDPEASSSSRSSHGSADEDFNNQRNKIRAKIMGPKKTQAQKETPQPQAKRRDFSSDSGSDNDQEAALFQKRLEEEKRQQMIIIEKKKAQAEERKRREQLQKQSEMIQQQQEIRRKEKDELMAKLKKQDEERKKRKREEKEAKEREQRRQRQQREQEAREKQEEKEREAQEAKDKKEAKDRLRRAQENEERMKQEQENSIIGEENWKKNGKTDVPCLFDKRCSYMSQLFSLPVELETQIRSNKIGRHDRQYKCVTIPLGSHLNNSTMSELVQYFLLNSNMHKVCENPNKLQSFPLKCIGVQMTVAQAPLNKPSLKQVAPGADSIRVMNLIFDSGDELNGFEDMMKSTKLSKFLNQENLKNLVDHYGSFMKDLGKSYAKSGFQKDFPLGIKSYTAGLLEFENEPSLQTSTATLADIIFQVEYTRQDDEVPLSFKNSFEIFRRQPTFFAYNQNKESYTKWVPAKKSNQAPKIINKYKSFDFESVCVILKDLSFDPIVKCKSENSLAYLLKKSAKEGLDICGLRMVYMDAKQHDEYYKLFHEKIELNTWEKPVLALVLRGIDASRKIESIMGHFNPETARLTDQKSLRACFGRDIAENCAIQIFDKSKTLLSLKFWFGGRVEQEKFNIGSSSIEPAVKLNTTQLITPTQVEKHLLFLSPSVPCERLPAILQLFTTLGITVLDIQKIDFSQFQYMAGSIEKLKTDNCSFIRGKTFKSEIGFMIKLARENLRSMFLSQSKILQIAFDGLLEEFTIDHLLFMTSSREEYKRVQFILKKGQFKSMVHEHNEKREKRDANYDSEDPDNYNEIQLFEKEQKIGKNAIKSVQAKLNVLKHENKFSVNTCVCFIKVSTFKKQAIGDTLHAILNELDAELLGIRLVNAKKDIFKTTASSEVQKLFKCIAYKFHELSSELKLRQKLIDFKTLVLVLRGQNLQGQIDKIYDQEKFKFRPEFSEAQGIDEMSYQGTPHTLFVLNNETKKPLIDFFMDTQFVKLYTDMTQNHNHLNNSIDFYDNFIKNELESEMIDTGSLSKIKSDIHLLEESKSSIAVCVIKPNQPMQTVLRALRSIANNLNPDGLAPSDTNFVKITDIQFLSGYTESKVQHLIIHDILYDEQISNPNKNKMRYQFQDLFDCKDPILQLSIEGINALTKLKSIIGEKDPRDKEMQTLRNFYGVDRVDNAFYVSETVGEAIKDKQVLFQDQEESEGNWQVMSIKQEQQTEMTPVAQILKQNKNELALILISPTLVTNHDFIFVIDEFNRAKFNIVALKKCRVEGDKLESLFKDLTPRVHNLEMLSNEFTRGESVLVVLEKSKAIEEAQEIIGKFSIKIGLDWEKKKKKKNQGFQFMNKYSAGSEENNMISEYGSYIFSFPNEELNKEKIAREFRSLPNTKNFELKRVD